VTSPTVLLMLEEPHQLEIYGNLLGNKGYETLMCLSPDEGIGFLEAKEVSTVIVSQGTPAFEGRPMLERSVQLHPTVPVLVVTRVVSMHCYLEAMDLGAFDYLQLPDPQNLARVVDMQMLRGALAGTMEWNRLLPILKSGGRACYENSPAGGWLQPLPRWETPKFSGSTFSLPRRESARGVRMKHLRKPSRDISN
jgi:two-component system response regulator (stage 0 sporulation protein F)